MSDFSQAHVKLHKKEQEHSREYIARYGTKAKSNTKALHGKKKETPERKKENYYKIMGYK
jgi:hypothetical protein